MRPSGDPNLLSRSLAAMSWSYGGTMGIVLVQLTSSVLFARLLGARITGVFAFGLLVFAPFRLLCEFGIANALVEKEHLQDGDLQLGLGRSLLFALLAAASWLVFIPWLSRSMGMQGEEGALDCFALVFLSLPVQAICTAVLTRRMDQKSLQVSSLVAYALGYLGFGAVGAVRGWGALSLVLGFLVQNIIAMAVLMAYTRIKLTPKLRGDDAFIWRFGSRTAAINISNWLTSSVDNMAVAWFFGTRLLGVYSIAYGLVRSPADKIVTTLQNVLFPASLLARSDRERLIKGCVATVDAVFMLTAPAFCLVAALSPNIVFTLYGPGWEEAATVLPPLALAMIFHCLTVIVSALLWGSGGIGRDFKLQWISALTLIVAVSIAGRFSFVAIAWMVLPVTMLRALWGLNALRLTVGIALRRLGRSFVSGLALAAIIVPVEVLFESGMSSRGMSPLMRLLLEIVIAGILWPVLVALIHGWLMTPELQAGLQSVRVSLRLRGNHA